MSEKRIITIRSGNEEVRMEVTEEEYQRYFCCCPFMLPYNYSGCLSQN